MNIEGNTIILTGARRIGQTVAEELAKKGANLAITYRSSKEESEAMCAACLQLGVRAKPFQADLSNEEEIRIIVKNIKKEFGRIDALVHMAAIYEKTPWDTLDEEAWNKNQNIIARSSYLLGKSVGDILLKNSADEKGEKGVMIFITDWSTFRPYKDYLPYYAAKSSVWGLIPAFANELAPHVRVNGIAPGPMIRPSDLSDKENEEVMSRTPLGRWGEAMPIAKGVNFLFECDFITGQIIVVDGGRSIKP